MDRLAELIEAMRAAKVAHRDAKTEYEEALDRLKDFTGKQSQAYDAYTASEKTLWDYIKGLVK